MPQKPPAFQLYVKDWLTSPTVMRMSRQDRGDFINLLAHAWCSDEPGTFLIYPEGAKGKAKPYRILAQIVGIRPQISRSFLTRFPEVFKMIGGRLVNEKLHDQWLRYKEISEKRTLAANARHANAEQMHMQTGGSAVAVAVAPAFAHSNTSQKPPAKPASAAHHRSESEQRRIVKARDDRQRKEQETKREARVGAGPVLDGVRERVRELAKKKAM